MGACSKFVGVRNDLVTQREAINAAWSAGGCGAATPRRPDSEPGGDREGLRQARNRGLQEHRATRARRWAAARLRRKRSRPTTSSSGALSRLLVISENYPQLRSNENFLRLQDELAGTENRIAVERRKYNEMLQRYNTSDRSCFPNNIVAGMCGFHPQRCVFQDRARRSDQAKGAILNMFGNYINGEWVTSGATFENRNPANTDEVVGTVREGHGRRMSMPRPRRPPRRFPGWSAHERPGARQHPLSRPPTSWTASSNQSPPI